MTLSFTTGPVVDAGADASICEGDNFTTNGATASNQQAVSWSSSGTGSFTGTTTLVTTYIPSAADIDAGVVTLNLTAYGNSPCGEVTDALTLTINKQPTAFAGTTIALCAGLRAGRAAATDYSSISWSTTGSGSFVNGNTLTPIYTATALDIVNSPISFTLTANPLAPCAGPAATHTIIVDVFDGVDIDAGANGLICEGQTFTLDATVDPSVTDILWTTSGTGTFSDPTIEDPTYTPSAADIANGAVTLTLTAANPACNGQSDYAVLTITASVVEAGAQDSCAFRAILLQTLLLAVHTIIEWTIIPEAETAP